MTSYIILCLSTPVVTVLIAAVLLTGAFALVQPHTHYNHLTSECVYFDGEKQCRIPMEYCNATKDIEQTLGLCEDIKDIVIAGVKEPVQPAAGKCPITVYEGDLVKVNWISNDPDADIGPQGYLSYEYSGVLGEDGTWQTKKGDAGIHSATARVYDGEFWDETELCIEVLKSNTPARVVVEKEITVYEGETVNLDARCEDADGDKTDMTISGWMTTQTKKTGYNDAGDYDVSVRCVDPDGEGETVKVVVHVLEKNRPAEVDAREKEITVYEGDTVRLDVSCKDADGDKTEMTISGWMDSETKKTGYDDAGDYDVKVRCVDANNEGETVNVVVHVLNKNRPPVITWQEA